MNGAGMEEAGGVPKSIQPGMAAGRAMLTWEGRAAPGPVAVVGARLVEMVDPRRELPLARVDAAPTTPPTPQSFLSMALPNLLYYGDNRDMLAHLLAHGWAGQVRMIYIDPPFDSGGDYSRKVRLRSGAPGGRPPLLGESVQYRDTWSGDSYLQFIYERLFLLRDLLAPNGSIWLHCDYRQVHRLRLLLEEVFGEDNYLNTIAWRSQTARGAKVNAFYFPFSTQYIEIFGKDRGAPTLWRPQKKRLIFRREEAAAQFMEDEQGFFRTSDPGTYSFARLKLLHTLGRLYAPFGGEIVIDEAAQRVYASNGGNLGVKYYLTRVGRDRFAVERGVDNLWDDIPGLGTTPGEDVGYPTQKTEALLHRVIAASTHPGDLVLDCFMGSGTTAAAAHKMGRRWIGCDLAYGAIQTTRRRLQRVVQDTGPGFAVYHLDTAPATFVDQGALTVDCRRTDDGRGVEVTIVDYQTPPTPTNHRRVRPHVADDWRAVVDSVDIDSAFDGAILRPVVSDLPTKKREAVTGRYVVAAPARPPTLAVRLTDIFGHEHRVTQEI